MKTLATLDLAPLGRLLSRVQRRRRVHAILALLERWFSAQIIAAGSWVAVTWLFERDRGCAASTRWLGLAACGILPILGAIAAVLSRKPPKFAVSLSIDRQIDSDDLLTSAICFAQRDQLTPLERRVIELAVQRANSLNARRLVPLGPTKRAFIALGCLLLLAAVPRPSPRRTADGNASSARADPSGQTTPVQDESSQIRLILEQVGSSIQSAEAEAELTKVEELLQAQAEGRLGRDQLLGALAAVSRRLETAGLSLEAEFQGISRSLSRYPATQELGRALKRGRAAQIKAALDALEKRWRDPITKFSPDELASLRNAVLAERNQRLRAAANNAAERSRLQARAAERAQREGRLSPDEQSQRLEGSRQLEQLDRRNSATAQVEPVLSALDRAILDAAKEVGKQLGWKRDQTFEGFRQANAELERLERQQRTDEDKRALLEKIRQISELLRRQQGSRQPGAEHDRAVALWRYGQRAQGSNPDPGGKAGQGRPTAEGQPNPLGSTLLIDMVPVPFAVDSPQVSSGAHTRSNGGPSAGDRHEAEMRGTPPTKALSTAKEVVAVSQDGGHGTVSAEVVATAAHRGFRHQGYREVFQAYAPVRESLLAESTVAPSDKEQIRRYFQLIQPR